LQFCGLRHNLRRFLRGRWHLISLKTEASAGPIMSSRLTWFGVLLIVLAASTGVLAWVRHARAQGSVERRFDELDKNADGKVTRDELPAVELFQRFDLDGDGQITKPEALRAVARGALRNRMEPTPAKSPRPAAEANPPMQVAPARPDAGQGDSNKSPLPNTTAQPAVSPMPATVRQGPRPLRPGDHGVGTLVEDVMIKSISGAENRLSSIARGKWVVFAMTSTTCPLSRKYLPSLVNLSQSSGDDVVWILVNPQATDSAEEIRMAADKFQGRAQYVHDREGELATAIGAKTTTDVVVLDASRTVAYHGAIDDQYGFGYSLEAPRHAYLADALAALRAGKEPLVSATEAPGCELDLDDPAEPATAQVTYHNRVSRIMDRHCVECHRPGGVGPFALETYAQVVDHAGMIKRVIEGGIMPPWFAARPSGDTESDAKHSPWANERVLAAAEKHDLLRWLTEGKPEGSVADALAPRVRHEEWLIGKPDAVFEFARPVPIKATGVMPYQNIVVETKLDEDKWVQAIEVRPGNRQVVHHVLVFVRGGEEDGGDQADDEAEGRGGFWAIYVPGNSTLVYPEGFAKKLPKNATLRFQMHYTPNGEATTDQTRIGVIYAKQPPQHEVRVAGIVNARINIPPGAENHREVATLRVPFDAQILGFLPHMHLRGKACRYELTSGRGSPETLLDIPRYDFNWQLLYRYHDPLPVRAGDTLQFVAWFDNSAKNPANPDPTKTVRWGAQTYDEMHLGYVEYFVPGAKPGESASMNQGLRGALRAAFSIDAIFKRLDRNQDDRVTPDELPADRRDELMKLDSNNDGAITLEEARRLAR
jgi:mono/diheme cytochrome c family protein